MIIPSIDICGGRAVQLVGGEALVIDAGDPIALLERFSVVGEVAVVDIDAARGEGHNRALISRMCHLARVRVGGGIRDVETARYWLDCGADRIVIGTAADPALLEQLPRNRVIVALDSKNDVVVSHGWRRDTATRVEDRIDELSPYCSGFLLTFVELEGRQLGTDVERAAAYTRRAGDLRVTVAGGVTTPEEVAALDTLGADAQIGMALYTGELELADAIAAVLVSDRPDGLWPTVVTDEHGIALGLAWSDDGSLSEAIETRAGVYRSRSRGLWAKGETSGATQHLLAVSVDCDRDVLRFTVRQHDPGFCHTGTRTCWGEDRGLSRLARRLAAAKVRSSPGSNTMKLLTEPALLASKLVEEASELAAASSPREVIEEIADLIYFALVKAVSAGVSLEDVTAILDQRELQVGRRPMEEKNA